MSERTGRKQDESGRQAHSGPRAADTSGPQPRQRGARAARAGRALASRGRRPRGPTTDQPSRRRQTNTQTRVRPRDTTPACHVRLTEEPEAVRLREAATHEAGPLTWDTRAGERRDRTRVGDSRERDGGGGAPLSEMTQRVPGHRAHLPEHTGHSGHRPAATTLRHAPTSPHRPLPPPAPRPRLRPGLCLPALPRLSFPGCAHASPPGPAPDHLAGHQHLKRVLRTAWCSRP